MTCTKRIVELVECARRRTEPGRELRAHLAGCAHCAERWENERRLTDEFRTMRTRAVALMAHDTQREVLMRDFATLDFAGRQRRTAFRSWVLVLSGTAAVFAAILAGHIVATHTRPSSPPAIRTHGAGNKQAVFYEASADASELTNDDFIAVPYTPPLAEGELVRVVHADLYPEALASMGIDVDPAWAGDVAADVVVGEDGIPRAVRFTEDAQ